MQHRWERDRANVGSRPHTDTISPTEVMVRGRRHLPRDAHPASHPGPTQAPTRAAHQEPQTRTATVPRNGEFPPPLATSPPMPAEPSTPPVHSGHSASAATGEIAPQAACCGATRTSTRRAPSPSARLHLHHEATNTPPRAHHRNAEDLPTRVGMPERVVRRPRMRRATQAKPRIWPKSSTRAEVPLPYHHDRSRHCRYHQSAGLSLSRFPIGLR
jgi:hypothetical protein